MRLHPTLRLLLALGISLVLVLVLLVLLLVSKTLFDLWETLARQPTWIIILFGTLLAVPTAGGSWLVWRLLRPPPERRVADRSTPPPPPDAARIEQRIQEARDAGADLVPVQRELVRHQERKATGRIHVALYGDVSSGKSSLIQALLPTAAVTTGVTAGTTRDIVTYQWSSPAGDELVLQDMPGLNEPGMELERLSQDEALRSHIVIYVCDGDLTRTQFDELRLLLSLGKPTILALNKADRYEPQELEQIRRRLQERAEGNERVEVVAIVAGGTHEVLRVHPDGREEWVTRTQEPELEELRRALQRFVDEDFTLLEQLRDSAVFVLVNQQIEESLARRRREQAEVMVKSYSKRAVLGALAAVTPGTDILIQGYLALQLIKNLANIYGVSVRKVDSELLLSLIQRHVGKTLTLTLAVAGNALKAFPGMGTLAGGLLHAVAYGLIFESLGRAVAISLDSRGELHPVQAANTFKEQLGEDLEASARRLARLALEEHGRRRQRA